MKKIFNVYELNYPQEFINKLPINWNYWKNKNLSNVPEIYHVLFITDWNWGEHSKMDTMDRAFCHELYLEYNKWDMNIIKESHHTNGNGANFEDITLGNMIPLSQI